MCLPICLRWTSTSDAPALDRFDGIAGFEAESPAEAQPSPSALTLCAIRVAKVIGNPHVQGIAGGMMLYGLATWWLGGSGLLIGGIGASLWLLSILCNAGQKIYTAKQSNADIPEGANDLLDPDYLFFTSVSAGLGWATPMGWIALGFWDLYWAGNRLQCCCRPDSGLAKSARNANPNSDPTFKTDDEGYHIVVTQADVQIEYGTQLEYEVRLPVGDL